MWRRLKQFLIALSVIFVCGALTGATYPTICGISTPYTSVSRTLRPLNL
jgi:hypothetical protein